MPLLIALPLSLVAMLIGGLAYGLRIEMREHPGDRLQWESQVWQWRERLSRLQPQTWQQALLLCRARRSVEADMAALRQALLAEVGHPPTAV